MTSESFHKLGWFRLDEKGPPFVQHGEVFLDKIHHARADDCAEQRFQAAPSPSNRNEVDLPKILRERAGRLYSDRTTWRRNEKGRENGTESDGQTTGWEETERRRVRIQLDTTTHSTILDEALELKLSMLGLNGAKSAGALDSAVYFVENHSDGSLDEITGKIAVNRITEHDKLGWFRLDEKGPPFVQYGQVFLDKTHHARG
ncbi:hypothetical protein niasHT_017768 [Heterodera trifolii]|uniref:Uncharacterized protein n=1 Tax=Heterodera trifolii TaxID=157864 RepID=A0ABD2LJH6_9BILA